MSEGNALVDRQRLEEIAALNEAGKPDFVVEMLGDFEMVFRKRYAAAVGALDSGQLLRLQEFAHTMKSSSANVGAVKLAQLCRALENAAKREEPDAARELLWLVIGVFGETLSEVAKIKAERA